MSNPVHIKRILHEQTIILRGADRATLKGFTQVPNFVLEDERISTGAKLVYAMLLKYAWHENRCFPGQCRLAKEMGAGRRSVGRYLQELTRNGLISVERQGQGKTNVYILHLVVDNHKRKNPDGINRRI